MLGADHCVVQFVTADEIPHQRSEVIKHWGDTVSKGHDLEMV
jgi:hypothetical protein